MRTRSNSTTIPEIHNNHDIDPQMDITIDSKFNIIPFSKTQKMSVLPEILISNKEAKKRLTKFKTFVYEVLTPGIDYGIVSGFDKPVLLKPGAEKLCDSLGFTRKVDIINKLEDWNHGIFHYEVRVTLISKQTNMIEADGVGSCNSKESRYCNQNSFDVINTVLKMAKKRALVDAVLTATRSSDLFTQDVEDMNWFKHSSPKKKVHSKTSQYELASTHQLNQIFSIVALKKIPVEWVKLIIKERYKVTESKQLTIQQSSDLLEFLIALKEPTHKNKLPSCSQHADS